MDSVLAIDPGPVQSAWIIFRQNVIVSFGLHPNEHLRTDVCEQAQYAVRGVAIEMIASYGMPVGAEVFETCVWIGRFKEALVRCRIDERDIHLVKRQEVKLHLCKSPKANDSSIRQALIDRFGPGKDVAIGNKAKPGPLYGVKADIWAALGVACTLTDRVGETNEK